MAPANIKKEGAFFDLPIAIGILTAIENINPNETNNYVFIGELSLDGKIKKVNGILPMCIEAKKLGIEKIILPIDNAREAGIVKGIQILPAGTLQEVVSHLNKEEILDEYIYNEADSNSHESSKKEIFDFADVKGQENIKRALEVAASGSHNCLLVRKSSAHGKTMMAKRLPGILPDLTFEESLEITKIHSIAGVLPKNTAIITKRPFRSPHNTASRNIFNSDGGRVPKPRRNKFSTFWCAFLR